MDKVKVVLAVLKKYHFWVLSGLIVLISVGIWLTATADLAARFDERKQQLDASFRSVESISNVSPHPNQKVIDATNSRTEDLKQDVFVAWRTLYQEQTEKNKLADSLTDDFKREFYKGGELSQENLEVYRTFILDHFETLFNDVLNVYRPKPGNGEPVAATPTTPTNRGGGLMRSPASPGGRETETATPDAPMIGTVAWGGGPKLKNSFDWPTRPTTEKVRTSQEDLWVYEALFRVIRDTNLDPTATEPIEHHNAAVREIYSLEIGSETFGPSGNEFSKDSEARSRYVDQNGQPILEGAAGAAEYNIMPIRMVVSIDQTKIPKLLAECGNSNMPIEVRNVRIRPGEGQDLNLGGTAPSNRPGASGAKFGGPLPTGASHIPVAIEGLIYIYNPPDSTKLGTGALVEAAEAAAEAATQPATGATSEPAPGTGPAPAATPGPATSGQGPGEAPIVDPMQE